MVWYLTRTSDSAAMALTLRAVEMDGCRENLAACEASEAIIYGSVFPYGPFIEHPDSTHSGPYNLLPKASKRSRAQKWNAGGEHKLNSHKKHATFCNATLAKPTSSAPKPEILHPKPQHSPTPCFQEKAFRIRESKQQGAAERACLNPKRFETHSGFGNESPKP